jgi:PAS domain S-box-containing protein
MWRKYLKMPYKNNDWDSLRDKIIGLGESSIQKSYYPELQKRLSELERFHALLDHSNDPILLLQIPSWRFTDVTRSASEKFGYSYEKMLEMSLDDLVDQDEMIKIQEIFKEIVENKKSNGKETFLTDFNTVNGLKIPFEISASLVNFSDVLYIVMVLRDITERKIAEDKIRASLEEKKLLLREIHHRVKNNMQIISSLLYRR